MSRQGRPNQEQVTAKVDTLCENVVQKGASFKIMKIENGTQIQLVINVRDWDPLKAVPRSGFEKNM